MSVNVLAICPPTLDMGWRVRLFPNGTTLAAAVAVILADTGSPVAGEAAAGKTVAGETLALDGGYAPRLMASYWIRTTGDYLPDGGGMQEDHGWRDVVKAGMVAVVYRLTGPTVHNP